MLLWLLVSVHLFTAALLAPAINSTATATDSDANGTVVAPPGPTPRTNPLPWSAHLDQRPFNDLRVGEVTGRAPVHLHPRRARLVDAALPACAAG